MEPDSTLLVIMLLLIAAGAVCAAIRHRHLAVKVGAGVLALLLAVVSGVAVVNVYYGYYQTWGQLSADLTNSYSSFTTPHTHAHAKASAGHGEIRKLELTGRRSGIAREAYVYLPPQYFDRAYAHTRFPVVELLHGSPGSPVNWVLQINIQSIMDQLIDKNLVGPMIVVMPSIDAHRSFQDCVDAPGALDDTYISQDVPADVRADYRASLVPAEWGIGGYSSGGYCAANLVMRHRSAYGAAGIMDGYFRPTDGPAAVALHSDPRLEAVNNPLMAVERLGRGASPLPSFWISAGTADAKYSLGARAFVHALHGVIGVDYTKEPGAGHNFYAWRPAIPRMLGWMWQQIAPPALRVQFPVVGPVANSVLVAPRAPRPHGSATGTPRTPTPHPSGTRSAPGSRTRSP
jgi:enterochelin esterase-like enzyme